MNRIQFGEGACEKIRTWLDSYISNELLVETNHEVLRHLEGCAACSAELAARTRLRSRLKDAVRRQSMPAELPARVRERIRIQESRRSWAAGWGRWAVAIAASVVVCVGVWMNYSRERLPALGDRPAQNAYIQRVSASLAAVLKVGLGDHIHCSIFRKYPKTPPGTDRMEHDLGPYKGLLPLVKTAVPEGYQVIMAHQCSYAGRKFIHFTMQRGGELLSLVISRKNPGESLAGLAPALDASGVPVYQSPAQRYQVAGFEAGEYWAFVVSELHRSANLQVAEDLAPVVYEFLTKAV